MNVTLTPGTRVQAILLDENRTPLPDMIGTVVPVSEWPASFPEQWTDENTVIVRWDSEEGRKPFTPYRRDVAERVLREAGGLSPLQTFSVSTAETPQDHGPLAAPLSDRTLAKVLSRPAHVPSLVALDWREAADRLAEAAETADAAYATMPSRMPDALSGLRTAVADYRAAVQS
jgi:hypothetical protein